MGAGAERGGAEEAALTTRIGEVQTHAGATEAFPGGRQEWAPTRLSFGDRASSYQKDKGTTHGSSSGLGLHSCCAESQFLPKTRKIRTRFQ